MKKLTILAIALLVIGITGTTVLADGLGSQGWKPKIRTMGALGYGLATLQTNAMDFELLKIGIAGIDVSVTNETEEIKVGILYFGETKYRLKDIVIGNGSATANIYDSNDTLVGAISLNSYPKGDREVWAGTMTLNSVAYNAYIIQANRLWKAEEKAEKAKEYCANNPEKCKAVMKAVGQILCDPANNVSCRDKIKTFCEQYPDDRRCEALKLGYCRLHMENADCRNELMQECKKNLSEEACDKLGEIYQKFAENKPEAAKNAPAWFLKIRERLQNQAGGD